MRRTKSIIIIVALLVWTIVCIKLGQYNAIANIKVTDVGVDLCWSKAYIVVDINGQEYIHECTTNDWTQEQLHNNYIEK